MHKVLLMLLGIGIVFLIGCTSVTQSVDPVPADDTDSDLITDKSVVEDFEMEPTVKKKLKANPDLEDEIKTLKDGTKYLLHPKKILSGGPPKDGIPSLDNPKFTSAVEGNWLDDEDLVLGLNYKGTIRAYPLRILNWHELVNDVVDDQKVLISYCPLCRTGIAFIPKVDGKEVEFGTSGKLYNSELIMYDRKTDSYWAQTLGLAVVGPSTGQLLDKIPLDTVMGKDWKKTHPDTQVLSRKAGFIRDYDRSPYGGYDTSTRLYFPIDNKDDRLHPKEIIYGVEFDGIAKAYSDKDVNKEKLINDVVGEIPIVVVWYESLSTVKIFERTLDGETLTFELDDGKIVDNNGNGWTVPYMEEKLEIVDTFGHFWFSWASFYPQTDLYNE